LEVIPNKLTFFGGYGITSKMPTLLYLYPENAYFELQNINEYASGVENPLLITTTRVFEIDNSQMKIARNHKAEVGFNLQLGKSRLNVTAFHERLKNGYSLETTFNSIRSVQWDKYERNENGDLTVNADQLTMADTAAIAELSRRVLALEQAVKELANK
jgi:hypothetical protein